MKSATVRLQKFMSERGFASRRACAAIVSCGRVTVNGRVVVEPGTRIDPRVDRVALDKQVIPAEVEPGLTIALYKPRGIICSRNSRQGQTIYTLLPNELHALVPVGRLDKPSEGLLLLSSDGELVNRLTHPRFGQRKTYEVTVRGDVSGATIRTLCSRMTIDGYRIQPAKVKVLRSAAAVSPGVRRRPGDPQQRQERLVLEVVLSEGRNRQIRKMCAAVGLRVSQLERTAIQSLTSAGLRPGEWRKLTQEEIGDLDTRD